MDESMLTLLVVVVGFWLLIAAAIMCPYVAIAIIALLVFEYLSR